MYKIELKAQHYIRNLLQSYNGNSNIRMSALDRHTHFWHPKLSYLVWETNKFHFFITFKQICIFGFNYSKIELPYPANTNKLIKKTKLASCGSKIQNDSFKTYKIYNKICDEKSLKMQCSSQKILSFAFSLRKVCFREKTIFRDISVRVLRIV